MIINHGDGSKTNTDKLSDVDSMIVEKAEELRLICKTANRQLFLAVECSRNDGAFWNFIGESLDDKLKKFYTWFDGVIKDVSNNVFRLAYKNGDEVWIIDNDNDKKE
jgi:hypothetical protein